MDRVIDVKLVATKFTKDNLGQQVNDGETVRELVGTQFGISRQEWATAAQTGLNPECAVKLADESDWEGETIAEINGVRYAIYRTYPTNDGGIELYLRKNVGVNL